MITEFDLALVGVSLAVGFGAAILLMRWRDRRKPPPF